MELNKHAEVSLHGQAAGMEWTLERKGQDDWVMVIEGASDLTIQDEANIPRLKRAFSLTDEQASATIALFIGELEHKPELNNGLYAIAEEVWQNVPIHFRIIP